MKLEYFLHGDKELERLQLQARVWEPEAEAMLNLIEVHSGWSCIDLGCGAMGILGPLARRVGPEGQVIGIDLDDSYLSAAHHYVEHEALGNVVLRQSDVTNPGYPPNTFDLLHSRFLLPHVESPECLLNQMISLAKPGGIVAIEENDHSSWNFWPPCHEWTRFLELIEKTFALQGDINIGRRTYNMLRNAGLKKVKVRAAVQALLDCHPYMRMAVTGAEAMRERAVAAGITTHDELDRLSQAVEQCAADPHRIQISFTLIQAWGTNPGDN